MRILMMFMVGCRYKAFTSLGVDPHEQSEHGTNARGVAVQSTNIPCVNCISICIPHFESCRSIRPRSHSKGGEISARSQMSSPKTFRIVFNRDNAKYTIGELVTGNVIVDLDEEINARALKLSVKGEANVSWEKTGTDSQERSSNHDDHFQGSEEYFNLNFYLLGNSSGNGEVQIPAGRHQYSFSFSLPYNIPYSFEHANGHVRYTVKAVIDRPWRFDNECTAIFNVFRGYNLNDHLQECYSIDDDVNNSFCCFYNANVQARIRMPTTGYVPGQTIEITVNIHKNTSINVTKICYKLERSLEFHAKLPYDSVKTVKEVVNTTQNMGPFNPNTDIMSLLPIQSQIPSHLEDCNIIFLYYNVRVTIHTAGLHKSIKTSYPILIGTYPLLCTLNLHSPSAPIASEPTAQFNGDTSPPIPTSSDYAPPNVSNSESPPIGFMFPNKSSTSARDPTLPTYEECVENADNTKDH